MYKRNLTNPRTGRSQILRSACLYAVLIFSMTGLPVTHAMGRTGIHQADGFTRPSGAPGPAVVQTPQYCLSKASDYDKRYRCVIYWGSVHEAPTISIRSSRISPYTASTASGGWLDLWSNYYGDTLYVQTNYTVYYNVNPDHTHQITEVDMEEYPSWNNVLQIPTFNSKSLKTKINYPTGTSGWFSSNYPHDGVWTLVWSGNIPYFGAGQQYVYFEHDYQTGTLSQTICNPGYGTACPGTPQQI